MKLFKLLLIIVFYFCVAEVATAQTILNVSYDATRELYRDINQNFSNFFTKKEKIKIRQSHGGSVRQANAILHGLRADIVTLATPFDIDVLAENEFLNSAWRENFPNKSSPLYSVIVFLVKKGNEKNIKDWDDLVRDDVRVITPNPKTSGGAIWNYLAAWSYALKHYGNEQDAINYMNKLFDNVPILDISARNASITFTQRKIGDVLVSWESEALLLTKTMHPIEYEIIYPSSTIIAELPVAIVDKIVDKKGTREIATKYVEFLFSDKGQEIIASHFYRPYKKNILEHWDHFYHFNDAQLVRFNDLGNWKAIKARHFDSHGIFEKIYEKKANE